MLIIGCDYHPSVQQIAWADTETGDCGERRLAHESGEAEQFYREMKKKGATVRVGIEATGHSRWFERLLAKQGDLTSAAIRYSQYAAESEYQLSVRKLMQNTAARHLDKVLGSRNLCLRTC